LALCSITLQIGNIAPKTKNDLGILFASCGWVDMFQVLTAKYGDFMRD